MGNSLLPSQPIIYLNPSWSFLLKKTLNNISSESIELLMYDINPISLVMKFDSKVKWVGPL